jgi:hypothetical protein
VPNPSRWAISVNRNGFTETGVEVCLPRDGPGGVSSLSAGVGTRGCVDGPSRRRMENMIDRRKFIQLGTYAGAGFYLMYRNGIPKVFADAIPGGSLEPGAVPKYETPMLIPPQMPRAGLQLWNGKSSTITRSR